MPALRKEQGRDRQSKKSVNGHHLFTKTKVESEARAAQKREPPTTGFEGSLPPSSRLRLTIEEGRDPRVLASGPIKKGKATGQEV